MQKPVSIRKFDLLYLGHLVAGILAVAVGFEGFKDALLAGSVGTEAPLTPELASTAIIVGYGMQVLIGLALWFCISKLRLGFVKWLVVLLGFWMVATMPTNFVEGRCGLFDFLSLGGIALLGGAIFMLLQPDAKEWFAAMKGAQEGAGD